MKIWCGKCSDKTAQERHLTGAGAVDTMEGFLEEATSRSALKDWSGT